MDISFPDLPSSIWIPQYLRMVPLGDLRPGLDGKHALPFSCRHRLPSPGSQPLPDFTVVTLVRPPHSLIKINSWWVILSTAALQTKDFIVSLSSTSNQNMVLPLDTHSFWRQLNLLSSLILLINTQLFKVLKGQHWIHQKDHLPSKEETQLSQQKFILWLLSVKVSNHTNFWKKANHKYFLTNIRTLNNFFLYNGQKSKNSCKSPYNFKSHLVLYPGRSLKKKKKKDKETLRVTGTKCCSVALIIRAGKSPTRHGTWEQGQGLNASHSEL